LHGNVLIIGFGRMGKIASQAPLALGAKLSIIDIVDPDAIRALEPYGFKVYHGDGSLADVLRSAGAPEADVIIVCVDDKKAATRIVQSIRHNYPQVKVLVRAFDRRHTIELVKSSPDYIVRETFESALLLSHHAALALGVSEEEAEDLVEQVSSRDMERVTLEAAGGRFARHALVLGSQSPPQNFHLISNSPPMQNIQSLLF
jgi:glutathione-regulated potassium-efflux system ancillary protein KefC